ncbi:MAG: ATP-binding cassette domain-containing protein, partial [Gammaproteobacteria bacterium]
RQRVAIARALVTKPKVILADEPTGNLDSKTAAQVSEIMMELNNELDTAIIMVTHDMKLAATMDTIYELKDGVLTATQ